jgi:hypothetical protein
MKKILLVLALFAPSALLAFDFLPNKSLTPGAYASNSIAEICEAGYPERSRKVSQSTKARVYELYKVDTKLCAGGCKIDHLIPLSIGGSNDISNLWPHEYTQFWSVYKKTRLEVRLRREVCGGTLALADARQCIASNWTVCYNKWYSN